MAWATERDDSRRHRPVIAVCDACVLYPAPLRDLLLQLALAGLFRARWTAVIHDEWIGNLLAARPDLTRARLERTRGLMDAHARDCLVTGFEGLVGALDLPDPGDRHVLAAAVVGRADAILTFNLRDFPPERLAPYGVEALHPDGFVAGLLDLDEDTGRRVRDAAAACRRRLRQPPRTAGEYLDALAGQGLPRTVARLRERPDLL